MKRPKYPFGLVKPSQNRFGPVNRPNHLSLCLSPPRSRSPPGDAPPSPTVPATVGRLRRRCSPALLRSALLRRHGSDSSPSAPNRARSRNPSRVAWARRCDSPPPRLLPSTVASSSLCSTFFSTLSPLRRWRDGSMMGATPASPPCCLQSDLVEPRLGHAAMPPSLHSLQKKTLGIGGLSGTLLEQA